MPPFRHPPLAVRDAIRDVLAGAGLTEVVTHALVSPQIAETFRWESVMPPVEGGSREGGRIVTVTNPLSVDHSVLRPALVGSIVQAVSTNVRHGTDDVTIFEIGKGYGFDPASGDVSESVREWWRLAFAGTGAAEPASWDRPARPYDLGDAKGVIELVARRLGIGDVDYTPLRGEPLLHPGRAASVRGQRGRSSGPRGLGRGAASLDRRRVGPAGRPRARRRARRRRPGRRAASGGGSRDAVSSPGRRARHRGRRRRRSPGRQRSKPRFASLVAPCSNRRACSTSIAALRSDTDEKSLAFRLTFRAPDRTLAEAEVDAAIEAITQAIGSAVGGRIRT